MANFDTFDITCLGHIWTLLFLVSIVPIEYSPKKPIEQVAEKNFEYYWWQALVLAPAGFDLESSGCKWRQWMAFDLAWGPYLVSGRGEH